MVRRIDYDTEQYQDYARGRALTEQQLRAWIGAFGAVLAERRPLAGLDVGSGTGRFTPALASGSADYALTFLSWHHVQDKPRAARELARVLRPAGRLLLRANFSDHHSRPWLSEPLLTLEPCE